MKSIQEIVRDPEWQALRASLVGTWKKRPAVNVVMLRSYLAEGRWPAIMWDVRESHPDRLRRVHNYLTGSGFRTGRISHPEIDRLLAEVRDARRES